MIRINLLPVRQARQREYGKQQLLIGALIILIELVLLFVIYSRQNDQLEQIQGHVRVAENRVQELERQNQELTTLRQQLDQLQQTANVLAELEAHRAGPVQVLDEFKRILNPPVDELERITQEEQGWATSWDPTQVWINSFNESDRRLSFEGRAMSNDDVAEFHLRLRMSPYFSNVRILNVTAGSDAALGRIYTFRMEARVNYGLGDEQG